MGVFRGSPGRGGTGFWGTEGRIRSGLVCFRFQRKSSLQAVRYARAWEKRGDWRTPERWIRKTPIVQERIPNPSFSQPHSSGSCVKWSASNPAMAESPPAISSAPPSVAFSSSLSWQRNVSGSNKMAPTMPRQPASRCSKKKLPSSSTNLSTNSVAPIANDRRQYSTPLKRDLDLETL